MGEDSTMPPHLPSALLASWEMADFGGGDSESSEIPVLLILVLQEWSQEPYSFCILCDKEEAGHKCVVWWFSWGWLGVFCWFSLLMLKPEVPLPLVETFLKL